MNRQDRTNATMEHRETARALSKHRSESPEEYRVRIAQRFTAEEFAEACKKIVSDPQVGASAKARVLSSVGKYLGLEQAQQVEIVVRATRQTTYMKQIPAGDVQVTMGAGEGAESHPAQGPQVPKGNDD